MQWSCTPQYEQPRIEKGTLDITTTDFAKQPEVLLQGKSLFYWQQWPLDANGNFNPENLTAAGRGEFAPIATNDTPEGKAKNRRIEVILTPKLDEISKLLNDI